MTVIFLSITNNFPFAFSPSNTKIAFLCKGLQKMNDKCYIINSIKGDTESLQKGVSDGITYFQLPMGRFKNICRLPRLLKSIQGDETSIIVTAPDLLTYYYINILCKIRGYKMFVLYHEFYQSTFGRSGMLKNLQARYYDSFFGYSCDGIMPISEFLIKKCQKFGKPILKVPIVADFDSNINMPQITDCNEYFLYCGNAGYARVIYTLLDAFDEYWKNGGTKKLHLVLHGYPEIQKKIRNYVVKKNMVCFFNSLSYDELLKQYRHAMALFIPLDKDSIQDQARFSQKISEYLSSKRPIVTVNTGEIKYYFTDGENAYVIDEFDKDLILQKIFWIDKYPSDANRIGLNGFLLGYHNFDYIQNSKQIHNFIKGVINED